MGFIIWYKLQIEEESPPAGPGGFAGAVASVASALLGTGMPVRISNDIFSGQHILDADITLTMVTGAVASTFEIKMNNLSKDTADLLKSKQADGVPHHRPLHAKVYLGYFDDAPAPARPHDVVMEGAITFIKSEVNDNGIVETTLRGQEITGYKLRTKRDVQVSVPGQATADALLRLILDGTGVTAPPNHGLTDSPQDYTFKEPNALRAVERFAERSRAPVVLRDKQLFIKDTVGAENPVVTLTADENIVKLDDDQDIEEDPDALTDANTPVASATRTSFSMTVLGNPKLRVGQQVTLKLPDDEDKELREGKKLRIEHCVHKFSSTAGYTCLLTLADASKGKLTRLETGAHGVVRRFRTVAANAQQPVIEVGEVKEYASGAAQKHVATLYFNQSPPSDAVAPSVQTPVNHGPAEPMMNKPVASPFAFHLCGLIVPVYPKMRALLAHNLGLPNDAIVTGFLWADDPQLQPPPNQEGDYWLCLPTGLSGGSLPTAATPTANDLTDKDGRRVIQAKGLHIAVGESLMTHAGTRPPVEDSLADQIVIEHKSGTRITITSAGEVQIETKQQKISMTNGSVTLQLNGSAVEVT